MNIEIIDKMGSDLSVVNAARVSFNKRKKKFEDNDDKTMVYIMNTAENKALETLSNGDVELRAFVMNKAEQLWKKVDPVGPTIEAHFLLENAESKKFMTAISNISIEIKGNCLLYLKLCFVNFNKVWF